MPDRRAAMRSSSAVRPFDRRELLRAQQRRAFGDGEIGEVGHWLRSKRAGSNTGAGEAIGTWPFGGSPSGRRPRSAAAFTPSGNSFERLGKAGLLGQASRAFGKIGRVTHATIPEQPRRN